MAAQHLGFWRSMPWFDASGRFSPLKLGALILVALPAIWMVDEFTSGRWDFPSPFVLLIYHSGLWATYLLLLSLLVTPMRRIARWGRLAQLRRMLGVACFFYTALHIVAWFGLRLWNWSELLTELFSRSTLWVASVSFVVLLALAATSFDAIIRRLGAGRWKALHRLVYAGALLAVLHFLMSPGSIQGASFLMAGAYVWLIGWRLLERRRLGAALLPLTALGLISALFALFLQPIWLMLFHGMNEGDAFQRALAENIDPDIWQYLGVPPVWVLLAWAASSVALASIRRVTSPTLISQSHQHE